MSAQASEAFILRTYPLREADLIVSYFTRDQGKLRGVARRARKPVNRFGSALQRLSYVKVFYFHRENRDLDSLDSCELIHSQFGLASSYELAVGLDYMAELSEQLLPAQEPNERFFRLLLAVTAYLRETGPQALWPAVNYFTLWAVRLSGFLAPMELTEDDHQLAEEILRSPIGRLAPREWSRKTGSGLRRRLIALIEEQTERRLLTPQYMETLA
ncbi:MAG: DNA repair protein RecO [Bryobacterales bacterium]|nr:DNA repair protein RecO [Bryobacterales bacterium]